MSVPIPPLPPTLGIKHPAPEHALNQPAPDQALAENFTAYSDPELAAYTDEVAENMLDGVVAYMPIVLPLMGCCRSSCWPSSP